MPKNVLRCNDFRMSVCVLGSLMGTRQTVGPIKWWYTCTLLFLVCTHCVSGISYLYIFSVHLNSQDWGSKAFINVNLLIIKIMTAYRFTHLFLQSPNSRPKNVGAQEHLHFSTYFLEIACNFITYWKPCNPL